MNAATPHYLSLGHAIEPAAGHCLHQTTIGGLPAEVRELDDLRWLTVGGPELQSAACLSAPHQLILPNQATMLVGLASVFAAAGDAPSILNLGFGCGAFERFLNRLVPTATVTSVELYAQMVALAQRYFFVPQTWPVTVSAAEHFVAGNEQQYDLILCDLFSGPTHAACLMDGDFYRRLASAMTQHGVLALNLSPADDSHLLQLLQLLRPHFVGIHLTTVAGHGNVIVLLSKTAAVPWSGDRLTLLGQQWAIPLVALAEAFETIPPR